MTNTYVSQFGMANPFMVSASPATHGMKAALKTASAKPGAIVMRNYGHMAGGGSHLSTLGDRMLNGVDCTQSHAHGHFFPEPYPSFESYVDDVRRTRDILDPEIKVWASIGHFLDLTGSVAWEEKWVKEAVQYQNAGVDALELHFNSPGILAIRNRVYDFYQLVYSTVKLIKKHVSVPVMCKLPVEACDTLRAMRSALSAGADAVGPTARWKGLDIELDYRQTLPLGGGGYSGSQALPIICYSVAEARLNGIEAPIYAGGGVFNAEAAAKLIMCGSDIVQLGSLACCLGPLGIEKVIRRFESLIEELGYEDVASMKGKAVSLISLPSEVQNERNRRLAAAYRETQVIREKCIGCGRCVSSCWYEGIELCPETNKADKTSSCVGCGYCFSVCPTKALTADAGKIVGDVMKECNL